MQCPKCGKEIEENTQYCPNCGEAINTEKEEPIYKKYFNEVKNERQSDSRDKNQPNCPKYFGETLKGASKVLFIFGLIGSLLVSFVEKQKIVGTMLTGYDLQATSEFSLPIFLMCVLSVFLASVLLWCLGEHLTNQRKQIKLLEEINSKQK